MKVSNVHGFDFFFLSFSSCVYVLLEGILHGIETRTSAPVEIVRNENTLQSVNTPGLYPAGEGAGYAGGIVSAAVDGMRIAHTIASSLSSS